MKLVMILLFALASLAHAEPRPDPQMSEDPAERGRAVQGRVYADIEPDDEWLRMGQEQLFAGVWTRPGLTFKERRWIALSIAATTGSVPGYRSHLAGALKSGDMSEEELWEWLIMFTQYAGYFKAAPVWQAYREILAQRGSLALPETPSPPGDETHPE